MTNSTSTLTVSEESLVSSCYQYVAPRFVVEWPEARPRRRSSADPSHLDWLSDQSLKRSPSFF